ncbi:MAG: hypothetical protein KatS3mg059_1611 [Thermomicrobiales bacterium]|nr:MAG: hypothetical protein KatS3mg059_1611 [Thermomicrobiales bacterium]
MIAAFGRYWRSHRGSEALGLMIAIAGLVRLWPLRSFNQWEALLPVVTLAPLACACLIAACLHEPLHELERCAPARPAWVPLRVGPVPSGERSCCLREHGWFCGYRSRVDAQYTRLFAAWPA